MAFDNHLPRASQALASSQAATTLLLSSYHPAPGHTQKAGWSMGRSNLITEYNQLDSYV